MNFFIFALNLFEKQAKQLKSRKMLALAQLVHQLIAQGEMIKQQLANYR